MSDPSLEVIVLISQRHGDNFHVAGEDECSDFLKEFHRGGNRGLKSLAVFGKATCSFTPQARTKVCLAGPTGQQTGRQPGHSGLPADLPSRPVVLPWGPRLVAQAFSPVSDTCSPHGDEKVPVDLESLVNAVLSAFSAPGVAQILRAGTDS